MNKKVVRILSCFIPVKKWRKDFRQKYHVGKVKVSSVMLQQSSALQKLSLLPDDLRRNYYVGNLSTDFLDETLKDFFIYRSYEQSISALKEKVNGGHKIRVAFFVIYDATFPARYVFERMLNDSFFEPFIVVIPDTLRGDENMFFNLKKTYQYLSSCYDNVYWSYDFEKNKFIDFSDKIDLFCTANPYDDMTYDYYRVQYLATQGILSFYMNYGFITSNWTFSLYKNAEYNQFWRFFIENDYVLQKFKKYSLLGGRNAKCVGYAKMDALALVEAKLRVRKRIIIAPHHTVENWGGELSMSNFLIYANFFLTLPKRYPDIDFVFRPHPLLFVILRRPEFWGNDKVEDYLGKMKEYKNVEYQNGGEYFDTFVNSDALIHDCCSFIAEYLYTGHPCCFLCKDQITTNKNCNEFALSCLSHHYSAFCEADIISFIDKVVLQGKDTMKKERENFVDSCVKLNYPHVSDIIVEDIKSALGFEEK